MPITFGSVGDIISVCLLIKDLVDALNDCQGSAHDYQQLVKELRSLERVLLQVNQLVCKYEASPALNVYCVDARDAVENCRQSAEPFLKQLKTYSRSLKPGGSGNVVKDTVRKVQWKVVQTDNLEKFYKEITTQTNTLNSLLLTWNMQVIRWLPNDSE